MASEAENVDSKLIALVEQFPGLYDRNSADYNNSEVCTLSWNIISRKLDIPIDHCQGRWRYLRRRFTQTRSPTWQHYHSLLFLEPFIKRRKLLSNNSSDVKNQDDVIIIEEEGKTSEIPLERKRKIHTSKKEDEAALRPLKGTTLTEESVHSFCNSICNDLLKLQPQEMLNCRIDILVVIQKYMQKINDANNCSTIDTLVPELMKRFAEVENKITCQKMNPGDSDWMFLFCIKNLFSRLMCLKEENVELRDLLRNFQYTDQLNTNNESFQSVKHLGGKFCPTPEYMDNLCSQSNGDVQVESTADNMENETTSEINPTSTESVYFEETTLNEIIPSEIATLKENIFSNGIINNFCNFCQKITVSPDVHLTNISHLTARQKYYLRFGIRNLNSLVYSVRNDTFRCIPCSRKIYHLWFLNKHESHHGHLTNKESYAGKIESEHSNYIKRGVLKIGNSFRYCLLCQEHIYRIPHQNDNLHIKRLFESETYCVVNDEMYCFACRKSFYVTEYENHKNAKEHKKQFKAFRFRLWNVFEASL